MKSYNNNYVQSQRDKNIASLLAIFLGWTGVHKFYLGKIKLGVLYAVFSFTFIPFFLSVIDFLVLITMRQQEFESKYNVDIPFTTPKNWRSRQVDRRNRRRGKTIIFSDEKPYYDRAPERKPDVTFRTTIPKVVGLSANKAYQEGLKLFEDYQYRNALERFQAALLINRENPQILFQMACCNSLLEQKEDLFNNMQKAIKNGFKDFDKIQTLDALAYFRIQIEFDAFKDSGFTKWQIQDEKEALNEIKTPETIAPEVEIIEENQEPLSTDELLAELKKLGELRQNGVLTDEQFAAQKQKLFA
jgi:TM2 domain-containing membrane protein YozV